MTDQGPRACTVGFGDGEREGIFHMFGHVKALDEGNNPYVHLIAVVELKDGRVIEVEPASVRFAKS
ncbi:hypothetical protein ABH900_000514 [Stenotrophomonas sp. AN71]|uniref:hypothetical protein n=1 Tax=Stenotrophomonas sp. AN71 TaxID=3156253 RepID=UPI003D1E39A6